MTKQQQSLIAPHCLTCGKPLPLIDDPFWVEKSMLPNHGPCPQHPTARTDWRLAGAGEAADLDDFSNEAAFALGDSDGCLGGEG